MTEYRLRDLERKLSFVITPVDTFSGRYVADGHIRMSIDAPHKPPLVKREGHFVFYDLPDGEYKISISGEQYFSEALTVRIGEGFYTALLIPNRRYRLTRGMTWIEGSFQPNETVYVIPKGATGLKLARCEGDTVVIMTRLPWDLTNRHIAIGEERDLCFIKERLGAFTYRLSAPLLKQHERNAAVAPVSLGRTGEDGYLLCPIANLMPEHTEILLWRAADHEITDCRSIQITYGRGNTI